MRLILALLCVLSLPAYAEVEIRAAWVKPAEHGLSGVVSLDLLNKGEEDYRLVGASSPVSRVTSLQETLWGAFGRRQMAPVGSVNVPANSFVSLGENGLHIMLQGVKDGLVLGTEIPVTLQFEGQKARTIRVPVLGKSPEERNM